MGWKALVPPRPWVTEWTGLCLRYAQSFFGAPVAHRSAWHAWLATKHKMDKSVPIPNVPVLLWYSHVGAYDDGLGPYDGVAPGGRANWGHVTPIIPGQGIYSSPASGFNNPTFDVYETIAQVERTFNATYVGWSLDINGLLVAAWEEDDDMYSDQDRARDNLVAQRVEKIESYARSTFRALFEIDISDFKDRPRGIGRELLNQRKSDQEIRSLFRSVFEIDIDDFLARPEGIGREVLRLRDSQYGEDGTLAKLEEALTLLRLVAAVIHPSESAPDAGDVDPEG